MNILLRLAILIACIVLTIEIISRFHAEEANLIDQMIVADWKQNETDKNTVANLRSSPMFSSGSDAANDQGIPKATSINDAQKEKETSSPPPPSSSPPPSLSSSELTSLIRTESLLEPPFRVLQIGKRRTGSTFQFRLVDLLVRMKTPKEQPVHTDFGIFKMRVNGTTELLLGECVDNRTFCNRTLPNSFVLKKHVRDWDTWRVNRQLYHDWNITIFASATMDTIEEYRNHTSNEFYAHYVQLREELNECGKCEVERYQPIFGLTDDEVSKAQKYMELYGIIRQCCGLQMSNYNFLRLHGCNMEPYRNISGYPHACEQNTMTDVEKDFADLNLPFAKYPMDAMYNWQEPGDCARFEKKILEEQLQFNGEPFEGCNATKHKKL